MAGHLDAKVCLRVKVSIYFGDLTTMFTFVAVAIIKQPRMGNLLRKEKRREPVHCPSTVLEACKAKSMVLAAAGPLGGGGLRALHIMV